MFLDLSRAFNLNSEGKFLYRARVVMKDGIDVVRVNADTKPEAARKVREAGYDVKEITRR